MVRLAQEELSELKDSNAHLEGSTLLKLTFQIHKLIPVTSRSSDQTIQHLT